MSDNFNHAMQFVSVAEGGSNFTVVNGKPILKKSSKNDSGGPTKYGITQATLIKAFSQGIVSHNDIVKLTKDEAILIYKANYWIAAKCDSLDWSLCLVHFDTAVNMGVASANRLLQTSLNSLGSKLTVDGILGPKSLDQISKYKTNDIIKSYIDNRRALYKKIVAKNPKQQVFLNGWMNRLDSLSQVALSSCSCNNKEN